MSNIVTWSTFGDAGELTQRSKIQSAQQYRLPMSNLERCFDDNGILDEVVLDTSKD